LRNLAKQTDTGMPQEWQKLLDDNGITRAEQEQNPDQVSQACQNSRVRTD
jgi:hypothetical protein